MNLIYLMPNIADLLPPRINDESDSLPIPILIGISVVIILLIVLAIIMVLRMLKKKNINNNAQGLYGPPSMFNKKEVDPPEDLYGCPRPDGIDEEPDDISSEEDVQEDEKN